MYAHWVIGCPQLIDSPSSGCVELMHQRSYRWRTIIFLGSLCDSVHCGPSLFFSNILCFKHLVWDLMFSICLKSQSLVHDEIRWGSGSLAEFSSAEFVEEKWWSSWRQLQRSLEPNLCTPNCCGIQALCGNATSMMLAHVLINHFCLKLWTLVLRFTKWCLSSLSSKSKCCFLFDDLMLKVWIQFMVILSNHWSHKM